MGSALGLDGDSIEEIGKKTLVVLRLHVAATTAA
jgi:hypothetical protein